MTGTITSPPASSGKPPSHTLREPPAPAASLREEWTRYLAFVRRPCLPTAPARFGTGALATARLFMLDIAIMAVLLTALFTAVAAGLELPENSLNQLELDTATILGIVVAAPLLEEIAFRSWLSGRPGHVAAPLIAVAGAIGAGAIDGAGGETWMQALAMLGGFAAAIAVLALTWSRPPMRWFARLFPLFFWASTALFALVHLFNYEDGATALLLVLIVPQFVLGTILAYTRVMHGLWSAIALHVAHNGLIVAIVLAGSRLGV